MTDEELPSMIEDAVNQNMRQGLPMPAPNKGRPINGVHYGSSPAIAKAWVEAQAASVICHLYSEGELAQWEAENAHTLEVLETYFFDSFECLCGYLNAARMNCRTIRY